MSKDTFIAAYIEAAAWADTPEENPGADFSPEAINRLHADAGDFYDAHTADCEAYPEGIVQAGHDLWFTTCGHGVGYWENDDPVSQRLDAAAKASPMRHQEIYAGDDGLLYLV